VIDSLLEDRLSTLQSGQAIDQASLNHSLLLSDIPGVEASATV